MKKAYDEARWYEEEREAHIHGWDFSHIDGRCDEETPELWDYREVIGQYLRPDMDLLDVDTGGGEFLLSLGHPYARTAATEGWPPNAELCRQTLAPLGIRFAEADGSDVLPFPDGSFDIITNRHGSFNVPDIRRLLRPGGLFITQQVGADNDRALTELLLPGVPLPFPGQTLSAVSADLRAEGFDIIKGLEWHGDIRFFDVGALVWFARVIVWEFPGFSVAKCLPQLRRAQDILDEKGAIEAKTHRFLLVARRGTVNR